MPRETYTQLLLREFKRLRVLAERAIEQVSPEDFMATTDEAENGIAITVKHLAGNLKSRWRDFLTSDGEKPDRHRDREFTLEPDDTRELLMEQWRDGWELLFAVLTPLEEADFQRTVTIRGERLTALQAVNRQLTHGAYHVGQIVCMARRHLGESWQSLSVPKGESEEFNRAPSTYLEDIR